MPQLDRPRVIEIIDTHKFGPFYDHAVRIFDRLVKQRFECSSCGERKCAMEIEDTEEIKRLVKLSCLYCGKDVAEVNFKRVGPDPAIFEMQVLFCEYFAGKRTGRVIDITPSHAKGKLQQVKLLPEASDADDREIVVEYPTETLR